MKYIIKPDDIRDLTSFEKLLIGKGYEMIATSPYFNTYNGCCRTYKKKDNSTFMVGLMGTPTRIGITEPIIGDLKYTFLPSKDDCESYFEKLNLFYPKRG